MKEKKIKSGGKKSNIQELIAKINKIKTTHQEYNKTLLQLMQQARTRGDFKAIDNIYQDYQKDGKKAIDEINKRFINRKTIFENSTHCIYKKINLEN